MTPTSEGVWRWRRKDDKREFDLPVYNIGEWGLKISFLGVFYDIKDFARGEWIAKTSHNPDSNITKQIRGWIHPDDFKAKVAA